MTPAWFVMAAMAGATRARRRVHGEWAAMAGAIAAGRRAGDRSYNRRQDG
jgi:hypothetical protein